MTSEQKNNSIIALIAAIREQANAVILDLLAQYGITDILPAHGVVLRVLFEQSPLSMTVLAETIGRKKTLLPGLSTRLRKEAIAVENLPLKMPESS